MNRADLHEIVRGCGTYTECRLRDFFAAAASRGHDRSEIVELLQAMEWAEEITIEQEGDAGPVLVTNTGTPVDCITVDQAMAII